MKTKMGAPVGPNKSFTEKKDHRKVILSTLWIFAMFNYLYADVFTLFFDPSAQQKALEFTQGSGTVVLAFAVLMETAMAMVLLSRVLKDRANRWANIFIGLLHTALVAWSTIGDAPAPFYAFFATIEIATTLFIVWYAWKWTGSLANPTN